MDITVTNANAGQADFATESGPAVSDDLSTLTWCLDEIRTALEESENQLLRQLEHGGSDFENLESARNWLHQAGGALVILDLIGTTQLVSNAEGVLRRVADGQIELTADVVSNIGRAYNALCEYLQELLDGIEPQPMYLYPYLKSLLKISGEERINPADFFFPPIGNLISDSSVAAAPLHESDRKRSRTEFEAGLLRVLRQPDDAEAIALMLSAVKAVSGSLEGSRDANFWQVIKAWFTAISAGTHQLNDEGKRLLARLNLQLRASLDGAPPDCNPLLRHALFAIATGNPDSPELREVFVTFDLTGRVPKNYESPRYGNLDRRAITGAVNAIDEMKKGWEAMMQEAGGVMTHLGAFKAGLARFQDSIADLNESGLDRITGAWIGVAKTIGLENGPVGDALGVEVATSMLFVEQLFHGGMTEVDELDERCGEIAKRIDSTLHDVPVSDDAPQWLRDLSASVQERLTMSEFISEVQASIREAEGALDQWFRDNSVTDGLPKAAENFRQVSGVLKLFSHSDAAMASEHIASVTDSLTDPEIAGQADTAQLASSIGTLGFFVDALAGQKGAVAGFEFHQETGCFQYRGSPRKEAATVTEEVVSQTPEQTASQVADQSQSDVESDSPVDDSSTTASLIGAAADAAMVNEFESVDTKPAASSVDSTVDAIESFDTPESSAPSFEFTSPEVATDVDQPVTQAPVFDAATVSTPAPTSSLDSIADLDFDDLSFADEPAPAADAETEVTDPAENFVESEADFHADAPNLSFAQSNEFDDDLTTAQADLNIPTADSIDEPVPTFEFAADKAQDEVAVDFASDDSVVALDDSVSVEPNEIFSVGESLATEQIDADAADSVELAAEPDDQPEPAAEIETPAFVVEATVSQPETVIEPVAQAVAQEQEEVDEELLEIFLLEAEEVIEAIDGSLQQLQSNASDTDVQTDIRRSFHTLKGSSRMVGLMVFGEAGWAMEELMSHQLSQGGAASSDLVTLIKESNTHFANWVQALQAGSATGFSGDDLIARANALRAGESLPAAASDTAPQVEASEPISAEPAAVATDAIESTVNETETFEPESVDVAAENEPSEPIASETVQSEPAETTVFAVDEQSADDAGLAAESDEVQDTNADGFVAAGAISGAVGLASNFAADDSTESASEIADPVQEPVAPEVADQFVPAADPVRQEPEEEYVQIGDQQISAGLFEVFIAEIDDIKAQLVPDASDWQANPERNASEEAIRGVHSIKGSAALVNAEPGRTLADLLEKFLLAQISTGRVAERSDVAEYARLLQVMFASIKEFTRREVPAQQDEAIAAATAMLDDWLSNQSGSGNGNAATKQSGSASGGASVAAPVDVTDEFDEELLPLFVAEAEELLPQIDENLRVWQENPSDTNISPLLMRQLHTVKGSARMAGAMILGQRVHEMETRVEAAIADNAVPAGLIEELIAEQDAVSEQFEVIRDPNRQPAPEVTPEQAAASADQTDETTRVPKVENAPDPMAANRTNAAQSLIRVRSEVVEKMVNEAGEVSIARSKLENSMSGLRQSLAELSENVTRLRTHLREVEIQADTKIQANEGTGFARPEAATDDFDPLEFDRYTRFQELTRMLAESVNDVATVQKNASRHLDDAGQDLTRQGLSMRQLQNQLMSVRMVQFASVNDRLYRVVRQVAKELEKRVSLDVTGADSEVDRNILESMAAPLEHLLRNAVSHGIESPADRSAANKPAKGELHLDIRHDGNEIVMKLSDDGAGLNLGKIRAKAIERGLIEANQEVTDQELGDLIFHAGFSTATQVDQISGRGVGMDVVRSEVANLGGRVEVFSESGKGSKFVIHLPLTMSITQVMTASAGESMFAVPAASVEKVLQVKPEELSAAYEQRAIEWDGEKVPLYYIASLVDMPDHKPVAQQFSPVMVIRSGGRRIAVHADEVSKGQEVVVKNVGPQVSRVAGVAGATVMGNGDVVLILNLGQFVQNVSDTAQDAAMQAGMAARLADAPSIVMVVDDSVTVRKVTERLLTRENFDVVLAKDGVDALRQLQDITPDIMLVDIEMPRMDGFDLTRALRKDERFCKLPIVMITSRTADKHKNYAMSLGVDEFLGKPYIESELLGVIRSRIGSDKSEH